MTISLIIPPNLQIGEVDLVDARPGAVQRALQIAIERHLFSNDLPGENSDTDVAPELEEVLTAYEIALKDFRVHREDVAAFWSALFTAPLEAWNSQPEEERSKSPPRPTDAAFCLALHALCGVLAKEQLGWVSEEISDLEIEAVDETEGEDLDDVATVQPTSALWTLWVTAERAIATVLQRSQRDLLQEISKDQAEQAVLLQFVGDALLSSLVAVLPQWFQTRQDKDRAPRVIVVNSPKLSKHLRYLLADIPFRFTPQPLKQPVYYSLGETVAGNEGGQSGFKIDLIGYKRWNSFLQKIHEEATEDTHFMPEFRDYIRAVNIQMSVPWRINRPLLELVRCMANMAEERTSWSKETAAAISRSKLSEAEEKTLQNWIRETIYRPVSNIDSRRYKYDQPAEFLDHEQAKSVLEELDQTSDDEAGGTFYLPWKADYRGRIYAETPWLTPQGGDVQRALFEFERGQMLNDVGQKALMRHGANLIKTSRISLDLELGEAAVVSLEERESWVRTNENTILACAENPLKETFWRDTKNSVKKPFQFLAFCLAYRTWKTEPSTPIHLPVQIDGTCNGLQHIAALTGDFDLARAVNVLPTSDNRPGDIYSELASSAAKMIGNSAIEKGASQAGLTVGNQWLSQSDFRRRLLDRNTAKKVVMTIPYGASQSAQAAYVLESIHSQIESELQKEGEVLGLKDLVNWVQDSEARKKFVRNCTRGLFKDLKERSQSGDLQTCDKLDQLTVLASYVSLTLVAHLRQALSESFPSVDKFRTWLGKCADNCAGLPIAWFTPLGFPVCQDKFKRKGRRVRGYLGSKRLEVDYRQLSLEIAAVGQRNALLPNIIHSLDSTHLMLTLLAAHRRKISDIGTIHDCLLSHPNTSDALSEIVRDSFANMYRCDARGHLKPLKDFQEWMNLVARIRQVELSGSVLRSLESAEYKGADLLSFAAESDPKAKAALDLRDDIQKMSSPQIWLARQILSYKTHHYSPPKTEKMSGNEVHKLETRSLKIQNGHDLSPYFFS